ncbi:hypothetical protein [Paenibacillus sp. YN15]|uniref:hypothetical protein n=1 Tax=Paenibacillus sp. YN15 TaxID=1742774 RepID=UPI000DCBBC08|nr:hypothetical protein [Paenibacillus sp. YN15]RAV06617.1 hypothetical protein DQG13_01965 [Paenibacillus sp. YN15]
MLFFRKLEAAYYSVKANLNTDLQEADMRVEISKLKLLSEMVAYANRYEYLNHKRTKQKMKAFLSSKYDYAGVAKALGISRNSLEVSVTRASKKLELRLGSALDRVLAGDVDGAAKEFLIGTGQLLPRSGFVEGALRLLPEPKECPGVDWSVAQPELRLLKLLHSETLSGLIQGHDNERLQMILFILFGHDGKYATERGNLIQYFNEEIDVAEVIQSFQADTIYNISSLNRENVVD